MSTIENFALKGSTNNENLMATIKRKQRVNYRACSGKLAVSARRLSTISCH